MRINSRTAVVTGASSGIGAELARQLAAAGIKVGLTARRAEALETLADEIRSKGGTAAVAPADAADPVATRQGIARLAEELGPIDLLIVNAGFGLLTPGRAFSAETVERMVRVNLVGAAYAIEAVLPEMLRSGQGHLVGISSLAAYRGMPRGAGYCATKAGLTAMLECLRLDVAHRGIAVTAVHPGYVRTPMVLGTRRRPPFLMEVAPATRLILKGIAARRRYVAFPRTLAALMSIARILPGPIFDRVIGQVVLRGDDDDESPPPSSPRAPAGFRSVTRGQSLAREAGGDRPMA
jgi:short-subunit dehydrogenase